MKALIIKDTYVIWRQMKYFLILILIFSALPSGFNNAFAVIYTSMLPYTALAYDERSKWDQLAAMMPYSTDRVFLPGVMVLSVLGAVCILAISLPLMFRMGVEKGRLAMFLVIFLVCGAAGAIAHIAESVGSGTVFAFQGPVLGVTLLAALVLTAVSVPLSMRFYTKRQS